MTPATNPVKMAPMTEEALTPDEANAAACACDLYADEFCSDDQAEADETGNFGPRERELLLSARAKLADGGVLNFHPSDCDCAHEWCATKREVIRLRSALLEIAGHPVISESTYDNCDWHCTATLVALAKDTLHA